VARRRVDGEIGRADQGGNSEGERPARCEKGGAKKRPSVETEGRLTIACHMKNLQKFDVGVSLSPICLRPYLLPAVTKIMTRKYFQKN